MNIWERNYVNIIGDGEKTIVFARGFGCDQQMWGHLVEAFQALYLLVLFDRVGAGRSLLTAYDSTKYSSFLIHQITIGENRKINSIQLKLNTEGNYN